MICDLSLEALIRFSRLEKRKSLAAIHIVGLRAEHLEPMVTKGWLTKSANPGYADNRHHSPLYEITDAGHAAVTRLTTALRLELAPF
jgi:hypothetical protein